MAHPRSRPPAALSAEAKALWRMYTTTWELDEHAAVVLRLALETFDRLRQAQAAIAAGGLVVDGKPHPAVLVERDCRRDLVKALKSLGLELGPVSDGKR